MATVIIWTKRAKEQFFQRIRYARIEFGVTTAQRWQAERHRIEASLAKHPESYTPERLLADRKRRYRYCHIMRRFKIIYYYAHTSDTVHIVDIWDTRMNPEKLKKRI